MFIPLQGESQMSPSLMPNDQLYARFSNETNPAIAKIKAAVPPLTFPGNYIRKVFEGENRIVLVQDVKMPMGSGAGERINGTFLTRDFFDAFKKGLIVPPASIRERVIGCYLRDEEPRQEDDVEIYPVRCEWVLRDGKKVANAPAVLEAKYRYVDVAINSNATSGTVAQTMVAPLPWTLTTPKHLFEALISLNGADEATQFARQHQNLVTPELVGRLCTKSTADMLHAYNSTFWQEERGQRPALSLYSHAAWERNDMAWKFARQTGNDVLLARCFFGGINLLLMDNRNDEAFRAAYNAALPAKYDERSRAYMIAARAKVQWWKRDSKAAGIEARRGLELLKPAFERLQRQPPRDIGEDAAGVTYLHSELQQIAALADEAAGNRKTALERYQKAQLLLATDDTQDYEVSHYMVSNCYLQSARVTATFDRQAASKQLRQALMHSSDIGCHPNEEALWEQLGQVEEGLNNYQAAIEAFRQVFLLADERGDFAKVASTGAILGDLHYNQGEHNLALANFQKAINAADIAKEDHTLDVESAHRIVAQAKMNIAGSYSALETDNPDNDRKVAAALESAKKAVKMLKEPVTRASFNAKIAETSLDLVDPSKQEGAEQIRQIMTLCHSSLKAARQANSREIEAQVLARLAYAYYKIGVWKERYAPKDARASFEESRRLQELCGALTISPSYKALSYGAVSDVIARLANNREDLEKALALSEKSYALSVAYNGKLLASSEAGDGGFIAERLGRWEKSSGFLRACHCPVRAASRRFIG